MSPAFLFCLSFALTILIHNIPKIVNEKNCQRKGEMMLRTKVYKKIRDPLYFVTKLKNNVYNIPADSCTKRA